MHDFKTWQKKKFSTENRNAARARGFLFKIVHFLSSSLN